MVNTAPVRMLAGHDPHDPWKVEELLRDALNEAAIAAPTDPPTVERIVVEWVAETWRTSGNTRWAIATLARLGETHTEFDLGLFIGLDDEWNGGWGRLPRDLKSEAETELDALLEGKSE